MVDSLRNGRMATVPNTKVRPARPYFDLPAQTCHRHGHAAGEAEERHHHHHHQKLASGPILVVYMCHTTCKLGCPRRRYHRFDDRVQRRTAVASTRDFSARTVDCRDA